MTTPKGSAIAAALIAASLCMLPARAQEAEQPAQKVLRVCQDPNNRPFSSRDGSGFENRIAALFAADLGWKLDTMWSPQRMGFLRNTLRAKVPGSTAYKCDLATSVAFEQGSTTQAYYRSTYAMAYLKGRGLDGVKTLDDLLALDPQLRKSLRLGVFARSPVSNWLLQNGLIDQIVSYQTQTGDPEQYPGEVVEKDLANGKIDIAFIWGPIAGYFAQQSLGASIVAVPLKSRPGMQFEFSIAMAVRHGDDALKQRINRLIIKHQGKINAILADYGVPLVDVPAASAHTAQPISTAETLLFQSNQWHQVQQPVTLHYAYKKVSSVEPGFDDAVRVDVTRIHPDGSAAVALHFLTGARNVKVADLDHAQANPALLGFLERDIAEMKRLTGGATNYFRKRIRLALADGALTRPVKFTYQGRQLDGQEVSVQPYLNDPLHERFEPYVAKRYVFILSRQVAGGVYQIRTSSSAADGIGMEETLTLNN